MCVAFPHTLIDFNESVQWFSFSDWITHFFLTIFFLFLFYLTFCLNSSLLSDTLFFSYLTFYSTTCIRCKSTWQRGFINNFHMSLLSTTAGWRSWKWRVSVSSPRKWSKVFQGRYFSPYLTLQHRKCWNRKQQSCIYIIKQDSVHPSFLVCAQVCVCVCLGVFVCVCAVCVCVSVCATTHHPYIGMRALLLWCHEILPSGGQNHGLIFLWIICSTHTRTHTHTHTHTHTDRHTHLCS